MSHASFFLACPGRGVGVLGLIFSLTALVAGAADDPKGAKPGAVVGKCVASTVLLHHGGPLGKGWEVVPTGPVKSEDLLVGATGAVLDSKDGAVRMSFLGDLDGLSPYPVKEVAVILHENAEVDLDFTLERGRVDLVNRKEKGPAQVRIHVRDHVFDVKLNDPGTRMAFEIYGRWLKGTRFRKELKPPELPKLPLPKPPLPPLPGVQKDPRPEQVPLAEMVVLVLKGEAELKHGSKVHAMEAPPGAARIHWNSESGFDPSPLCLDKLPEWATAADIISPEARARFLKFRKILTEKSLGDALEAFINSDSADERRLAVFAMAALDDLPRLGLAVATTKHEDVLENATLALRQWIGRGPGQDQKLYAGLIVVAKYPPIMAETLVQFLHSFSDEDLSHPETYEMLIDFLEHERVGPRFLAYWHLERLVPVGKKFGYHALDPKEKREQAIEQWKKLIPHGKLPPRATPEDK